jgi:hypothetical protein
MATANNAQLQILHVNDSLPGAEESFAQEGIPGQIIVKTAWKIKIDLVIMGTQGVSGFRDFFIGSTSYYVIKRASCPVLCIPEGKKWFEFNKILFPVRPSLFSFKLYKVVDDIISKTKTPAKCKYYVSQPTDMQGIYLSYT